MSNFPPLGLLYLASCLRRRFGPAVNVRVIDAIIEQRDADALRDDLIAADVVGLSAMNCEADAAFAIARLAKSLDPAKLVVLGGPAVHRRADEILAGCAELDWLFEGEAEKSFPEAIDRLLTGKAPDGTTRGMYYRQDGRVVAPRDSDFITDLDSLPWPAWDLVDFDAYAAEPTMRFQRPGRRYATLFTSRGCPYKCSYCHDLFTKKFRWRSAEDVVAEIAFLVGTYGVEEFLIVDDIFNLHKPRVKRIFALVKERFPGMPLRFSFPNGIRADIVDRDIVQAMKDGGVYQVTVAIETVTERLQGLIRKHLDLEKARRAIEHFDDAGILVSGFFMLGFPTETRAEIRNTLRFALRSRLSFAHFFTVVPQPGTPLHALAQQESAAAVRGLGDTDYHGSVWYELATGYPLRAVIFLAYVRFFLRPRRLFVLLRHTGLRRAISSFGQLLTTTIVGVKARSRFGTERMGAHRSSRPAPGLVRADALAAPTVSPRPEPG